MVVALFVFPVFFYVVESESENLEDYLKEDFRPVVWLLLFFVHDSSIFLLRYCTDDVQVNGFVA